MRHAPLSFGKHKNSMVDVGDRGRRISVSLLHQSDLGKKGAVIFRLLY